jgi:hypothetical protein
VGVLAVDVSGSLSSSLTTLGMVDSEAVSIALQICFRISLLKCVWELGMNWRRGGGWSRVCISLSGLKPTKTSKVVRATAISGLWFVSLYLSGSFWFNLAARSLSRDSGEEGLWP